MKIDHEINLIGIDVKTGEYEVRNDKDGEEVSCIILLCPACCSQHVQLDHRNRNGRKVFKCSNCDYWFNY